MTHGLAAWMNRDKPTDMEIHSARMYDHELSPQEIAERVLELKKSDSPKRRARASMRLSGIELPDDLESLSHKRKEVDMGDVEVEGGGIVERIDDILKADSDDSARLTLKPLTDNEFDFVMNAVRHQRIEKAARLNEALLEIHGVGHYRELRVNPDTIPVLTWANPSEFERMIDYAAAMRAERDALVTKLGTILLGQGPPELEEEAPESCGPDCGCAEPKVERGWPAVADPFGGEFEGEWEIGAALAHQQTIDIVNLQEMLEERTRQRDDARQWARRIWRVVRLYDSTITLKDIPPEPRGL